MPRPIVAAIILLLLSGTAHALLHSRGGPAPPPSVPLIATYHGDNYRTGWNQNETTLTPANVGSLVLKQTIAVDEVVKAQPLFLPPAYTPGHVNGLVYVATLGNTIYQIDPVAATVLTSRNFGPATPIAGCYGSPTGTVGIVGTPVIDPAASILYFVSYDYPSSVPTFTIHAINTLTLADAIAPRTITATATLSDSTTATFNAVNAFQNPGLVLTNGNVYAGFGSFCADVGASRGWVLGWNATTLVPVGGAPPTNYLTDQQASSPTGYFLSSIWMSGFGIAADEAGSLYFSTGNSDYSGVSFSPSLNLEESAIKRSNDLTTTLSFFTASGDYQHWDAIDADFGASGITLLPLTLTGGIHPAIAISKGSPQAGMYFLDRDNMGGLTPTPLAGPYAFYGPCWCGGGYFIGADHVPRFLGMDIILQTWKILDGPPRMVLDQSAAPLTTGQDPGTFPVTSSNGLTNHIVWFVNRPQNVAPYYVTLYAFDPTNMSAPLFSGNAGVWPNLGGNATLTPTVANGRVIVGSYHQVTIWGL